MDPDSSSMEFHDVDDSPVKSVENLPKEKRKKKFGSLNLRRKSAVVETEGSNELRSVTLPRKKRRASITRLFNFGKKKSEEEGIENQKKSNFHDLTVQNEECPKVRLDSSQETICEVTSIGDASPLLRQASLIGLEDECKKPKAYMVDDDSSDSFKSVDSPGLRNDLKDSTVSYTHRGEQATTTSTQTPLTLCAESKYEIKQKKKSAWKKFWSRDKVDSVDGDKKVMSQSTGNVKKDRTRGRGSTPIGKPSSSTSSETLESPIAKPSSPKPDEETVRKSAEIGSQILQQKKEEGKRVTGDDLRKQLTEGLKNGSGKAKDVKSQISEITQNAVKTSAIVTEAVIEAEKKNAGSKDSNTDAAKGSGSSAKDELPGVAGGDNVAPSTSAASDPFVPPTESKKEHLYKILVIGELGTGKTSIIKRYVHQFFSQHYRATIGVDFALKVLNWDENSIIRLQLWDIAGQERFGNMTRVYYKEAVGAFIVFDVTRAATFDAVQKWKQDLDSKVQLSDGSPIPCILLANKCDQPKEGLVNNKNKMDEYCKENGFAGWFEASAKENINIEDAAKSLVYKILQNDKLIKTGERGIDDRIALDGSSENGNSKNCSC